MTIFLDDLVMARVFFITAVIGMMILVPWMIHDERKAEKALRIKKRNKFKHRWKF